MAQPWWRTAAAASSAVTPATPSAPSDNNKPADTSQEQLMAARGKLLLARYRRQKAAGVTEPLDSPAHFYRWSPQSAALLGGPPASVDSATRRVSAPHAASSRVPQSRSAPMAKAHSSADLASGGEDIGSPPDDGRRHTIADFATPLPVGWEMRASAAGAVFFVNRRTHTSTWDDPREQQGGSGSGDGREHGGGGAAAETTDFGSLRVKIPTERRQAFGGSYENTVTPGLPPAGAQQEEEEGVQYFDVVFKERGPIGIHFQANHPDGGATVRRLLPGTAAVETGILRPFDRLVAVNQHPVAAASFRHVMLLLQGGLRPLTLSFKRDLAHPHMRGPAGASSEAELSADLDEEVVLDFAADECAGDDPAFGGERRRSSRELIIRQPDDRSADTRSSVHPNQHDAAPMLPSALGPAAAAAAPSAAREEESVADKIITNIFSLFWTPPEPLVPAGEVQTV